MKKTLTALAVAALAAQAHTKQQASKQASKQAIKSSSMAFVKPLYLSQGRNDNF